MVRRSAVRRAFAGAAAVLAVGLGLVGFNAYAAETPANVAPPGPRPGGTVAPRSADLVARNGDDVPYQGRRRFYGYFFNEGPAGLRPDSKLFRGDHYRITLRVDGASGLRLLGYQTSAGGEETACANQTACSVDATSGWDFATSVPVFFFYAAASNNPVNATLEVNSDLHDSNERNNTLAVVIRPDSI